MATPCFAGAFATVLFLTVAVADGSELKPRRKHEPFDRYEDGHLEEPLLDDDYIHDQDDGLFNEMNSWYSTTTTTTTTTKKPKKSSCQTLGSPMDKVWMEALAPLKVAKSGTVCVFGVDARDEGGHCIHQKGKYGAYGWCFTKKDGSEWGSCNKECPAYGQEKKLNDRIRELEEKLADTRDKLIPELAKATAKANCMDCKAHSSLLGADAKLNCAKPCKGVPLAKSNAQKAEPRTKEARKIHKAIALVQQSHKVSATRQRRSGRAKLRSLRIAELESKLAKTKEWLSFLMTAAVPK